MNCNQELTGKYCSCCGEKVVEVHDFSIKSIANQVFSGFTNFDSKGFKSFFYLFLKPGVLSSRYVNGIRVPFMKPFQIFLITNILFFLFLTQSDIFRIPAEYYFANKEAILLEGKSIDMGISVSELKIAYNRVSTDVSKGAIIVLVPLLAFVLLFLNFKGKKPFGMHLIFAMHYISFFFLGCLIALVAVPLGKLPVQLFIGLLNYAYLFFAIKQFYKGSIVIVAIKTTFFIIIFALLISLYRKIVSDFTFLYLI